MGNSDDSDSDHAEYGTALEAIEEDEVGRKRPINVSEQVAVDERGRRRFHGAFTGGFSAGYFNTVGSKEGWAPSSFKSSRTDRGSLKSQNVLDFMDDEDKGAFGIAPQVLRPTEDFSDTNDLRGKSRAVSKRSDGPIPGIPILDQIIQPVRETVGLKILVRMGWRPGKGVGQRINRVNRAKRTKMSGDKNVESVADNRDVEIAKIYGCSLPPELMDHTEADQSSEDDFDEELLAPDDVNPILCNPKENTFGLGYKGLDRNSLTTESTSLDLFGTKLKFRVENKNLSISGQAFGVGAFEENDMDIYSKEDMSQYDFALETPDERKRRRMHEDREKHKKKIKLTCIEGFAPSSQSIIKRISIPPPILPSNFQPLHSIKKSRFEISKSNDENLSTNSAKAKGLARHSLTISERQVLIEDDVNKIAPNEKNTTTSSQITTKFIQNITPDSAQTMPPKTIESEHDINYRIERLKKFTQVLQAYSSNTTEGGNASFKPFMKNPEKQERYEKFLTLRDAGFIECLKDLQPPDMTEWERDREKLEFERASKLYKPMNSILASRFVSAKSHDISHLEPLREPVQEKGPKDDPKVAARMRLFGKLTHCVMEWHPDKLVCKRFNIPHPYPDSKFTGVKGGPSTWGIKSSSSLNTDTNKNLPVANSDTTVEDTRKTKSLFDNLDFSKPPPGLMPKETAHPTSSTENPLESSGKTVETSAAPVLEFHRELSCPVSLPVDPKTVTLERPPLDLFKEIFADSSDSEHDEEKTELETRNLISRERESESHLISQHMPDKKVAVSDDKPLNRMVGSNNDTKSLLSEKESVNRKKDTLRRGVFDRINLDRLQMQDHVCNRTTGNKIRHSDSETDDGDRSDEMHVYGPEPPKIESSSSHASRQQSGKNLSTKNSSGVPGSSSKTSHHTYSKMLDDTKKELNTEEVIWVEKSTLAQDSCSSKSRTKNRKHSSKKSHRKSSKKEKHKSHKDKRHKHKKKSHKHKKSKSAVKGDHNKSGASDNDSCLSDASSSDSVAINDSLDNRTLLAKLKQLTKSN